MRSRARADALATSRPPHVYFVGSAVFHYLGPAFAVLLFARVDVLGVAWLRIAARGADLRRSGAGPWRALARARPRDRPAAARAGARVLAVMNCCFYLAIDRLPLGTVAAIEFLPVIALAALGARTRAQRGRARARGRAASTCSPTCSSRASRSASRSPSPTPLLFAALHRARAPRRAQPTRSRGIDGLAAAMLIAAVVVTPIGGWERAARARRPGRARSPASASASRRR